MGHEKCRKDGSGVCCFKRLPSATSVFNKKFDLRSGTILAIVLLAVFNSRPRFSTFRCVSCPISTSKHRSNLFGCAPTPSKRKFNEIFCRDVCDVSESFEDSIVFGDGYFVKSVTESARRGFRLNCSSGVDTNDELEWREILLNVVESLPFFAVRGAFELCKF